jgi:hypothetical protein
MGGSVCCYGNGKGGARCFGGVEVGEELELRERRNRRGRRLLFCFGRVCAGQRPFGISNAQPPLVQGRSAGAARIANAARPSQAQPPIFRVDQSRIQRQVAGQARTIGCVVCFHFPRLRSLAARPLGHWRADGESDAGGRSWTHGGLCRPDGCVDGCDASPGGVASAAAVLMSESLCACLCLSGHSLLMRSDCERDPARLELYFVLRCFAKLPADNHPHACRWFVAWEIQLMNRSEFISDRLNHQTLCSTCIEFVPVEDMTRAEAVRPTPVWAESLPVLALASKFGKFFSELLHRMLQTAAGVYSKARRKCCS